MDMNPINPHLEPIRKAYPDLQISSARLHTKEGQFSDIVIVNESLIFRFPRTPDVAIDMAYEVALLKKLQGRLPLPIPNPIYAHFEADNLVFMGYPMIPGEPLWRETLNAITDEEILDRIAAQLAGFLKALHAIPANEITNRPAGETRESWVAMYAAMRDQLFPHMRSDACQKVSENFESFLNDPANFAYQPVLRHGDFGTGNILYDAQSQNISGIIDFSFTSAGDRAQDVGALLGYGESFMERCYAVYPEMRDTLKRVQFIRTTYALQQALYALRDGNREDFEDGMRDYV